MAIQSSTGSSSPTATETDAGSGNGTNTDNPPKSLSPSSSIPFSFLIAFIALFLFFLGCGLGTRRVAWALRRGFGSEEEFVDGTGIGRRRKKVGRTKPELWDVWPKESKLDGQWNSMQPLSVKLLSSKSNPSDSSEQPSSGPTTHPLSPVTSLGYFPSRFGRIPVPTPPPPHNIPLPRSGRTPSHADRTRRNIPANPPDTPRSSPSNPPAPPNAPPNTSNASNVVNPQPQPSTPPQEPNAPGRPQERESFWSRARGHIAANPYVNALLLDMGLIPMPRHPDSPDDGDSSTEDGEVTGIQVTVLVSMPSPGPIARSRGSLEVGKEESEKGKGRDLDGKVNVAEGGMGDYVIGIAEFPWSKPWSDEADLTGRTE